MQVEAPPAGARTGPPDVYDKSSPRVDILLTGNRLVDTKAWSRDWWSDRTDAEKRDLVNGLQNQIKRYLNANASNTLRLEFRASVPPEVTTMLSTLDPALRARVTAVGPPY